MALGPSCERFDGWLSSDSNNSLSPACQAKGKRLRESVKGQEVRVLLFSRLRRGDATRGYSGQRLTVGPSYEVEGQLEANGLHRIHSVARPFHILLCV